MKPILNPVPVFAVRRELAIPRIGEPAGLDLLSSDWVSPSGIGSVADFTITLTSTGNKRTGPFELALLVQFSNEGDGIQGLLIFHLTEEAGYACLASHPKRAIWRNSPSAARNEGIMDR